MCNLSDLGNTSMEKRNRSPLEIGLLAKHRVGDIGVPTDWWDIARDPFFGSTVSDDLYSVDVDKQIEET